MTTHNLTDTSIYVADLAAYNAGLLRGKWLDADCEPDELREEINNMLLESPESNISCTVCRECGHIEHYATLTRVKPSSLAAINGWTDNSADCCEHCGSSDLRQTVTAEEYAIHDTNGLDVGEYASIDDVCELASAISEHGEAYQAYISMIGSEYATVENFEEAYCGKFNSERDFSDNLADELFEASNSNYFDYEQFSYDLFLDGYSYIDGFVFRDC